MEQATRTGADRLTLAHGPQQEGQQELFLWNVDQPVASQLELLCTFLT